MVTKIERQKIIDEYLSERNKRAAESRWSKISAEERKKHGRKLTDQRLRKQPVSRANPARNSEK